MIENDRLVTVFYRNDGWYCIKGGTRCFLTYDDLNEIDNVDKIVDEDLFEIVDVIDDEETFNKEVNEWLGIEKEEEEIW